MNEQVFPYALVFSFRGDQTAKDNLSTMVDKDDIFESRFPARVLRGLVYANLVKPCTGGSSLNEVEKAFTGLAGIPGVVVLRGEVPIDEIGRVLGSGRSIDSELSGRAGELGDRPIRFLLTHKHTLIRG